MCCKPEHISTGFTEPCRADTSTCENTLKKFVMFKNKIFKQERFFFFFLFSVLIATALLLDVVFILPPHTLFLLALFYLKCSNKW